MEGATGAAPIGRLATGACELDKAPGSLASAGRVAMERAAVERVRPSDACALDSVSEGPFASLVESARTMDKADDPEPGALLRLSVRSRGVARELEEPRAERDESRLREDVWSRVKAGTDDCTDACVVECVDDCADECVEACVEVV